MCFSREALWENTNGNENTECGEKRRNAERYEMPKYTFEEIKALLLKCINEHKWEAELTLTFSDKPDEYMIIIYEDHCSFQRCGTAEKQSGEYNCATLDKLYSAEQMDGIVLEKDCNNIIDFNCCDFDILGLW